MEELHCWWEVPSIAHFCSLFAAAFNLANFDIEELENGLIESGTELGSSFLTDLICRLLSGCYHRKDITVLNYDLYLADIVRHRWAAERGVSSPLDEKTFNQLPLRTKVEILQALCDYRMDAEDVAECLKGVEGDKLRLDPIGLDASGATFWYFYGTRLYKEDPEPPEELPQGTKKKKERDKVKKDTKKERDKNNKQHVRNRRKSHESCDSNFGRETRHRRKGTTAITDTENEESEVQARRSTRKKRSVPADQDDDSADSLDEGGPARSLRKRRSNFKVPSGETSSENEEFDEEDEMPLKTQPKFEKKKPKKRRRKNKAWYDIPRKRKPKKQKEKQSELPNESESINSNEVQTDVQSEGESDIEKPAMNSLEENRTSEKGDQDDTEIDKEKDDICKADSLHETKPDREHLENVKKHCQSDIKTESKLSCKSENNDSSECEFKESSDVQETELKPVIKQEEPVSLADIGNKDSDKENQKDDPDQKEKDGVSVSIKEEGKEVDVKPPTNTSLTSETVKCETVKSEVVKCDPEQERPCEIETADQNKEPKVEINENQIKINAMKQPWITPPIYPDGIPPPTTRWRIVCATLEDWQLLAETYEKSRIRCERDLYLTLKEDFLPELPDLFLEKEKEMKKKLAENAPRRASNRLELKRLMKDEEAEVIMAVIEAEKKEEEEFHNRKPDIDEETKLKLAEWEREEEERRQKEEKVKAREERARRVKLREERARLIAEGKDIPPELFEGHQPAPKRRPSQEKHGDLDDLILSAMLKVLESVKNHPEAWPFLEPVQETFAPGYFEIIEEPMDLSTMEEKLNNREYQNKHELQDDFQLMVSNCSEYNGPDSDYTRMARTLETVFSKKLRRHMPKDKPDSDEEYASKVGLVTNSFRPSTFRSKRAASSRAREALHIVAEEICHSSGSSEEDIEEIPPPAKKQKLDVTPQINTGRGTLSVVPEPSPYHTGEVHVQKVPNQIDSLTGELRPPGSLSQGPAAPVPGIAALQQMVNGPSNGAAPQNYINQGPRLAYGAGAPSNEQSQMVPGNNRFIPQGGPSTKRMPGPPNQYPMQHGTGANATMGPSSVHGNNPVHQMQQYPQVPRGYHSSPQYPPYPVHQWPADPTNRVQGPHRYPSYGGNPNHGDQRHPLPPNSGQYMGSSALGSQQSMQPVGHAGNGFNRLQGAGPGQTVQNQTKGPQGPGPHNPQHITRPGMGHYSSSGFETNRLVYSGQNDVTNNTKHGNFSGMTDNASRFAGPQVQPDMTRSVQAQIGPNGTASVATVGVYVSPDKFKKTNETPIISKSDSNPEVLPHLYFTTKGQVNPYGSSGASTKPTSVLNEGGIPAMKDLSPQKHNPLQPPSQPLQPPSQPLQAGNSFQDHNQVIRTDGSRIMTHGSHMGISPSSLHPGYPPTRSLQGPYQGDRHRPGAPIIRHPAEAAPAQHAQHGTGHNPQVPPAPHGAYMDKVQQGMHHLPQIVSRNIQHVQPWSHRVPINRNSHEMPYRPDIMQQVRPGYPYLQVSNTAQRPSAICRNTQPSVSASQTTKSGCVETVIKCGPAASSHYESSRSISPSSVSSAGNTDHFDSSNEQGKNHLTAGENSVPLQQNDPIKAFKSENINHDDDTVQSNSNDKSSESDAGNRTAQVVSVKMESLSPDQKNADVNGNSSKKKNDSVLKIESENKPPVILASSQSVQSEMVNSDKSFETRHTNLSREGVLRRNMTNSQGPSKTFMNEFMDMSRMQGLPHQMSFPNGQGVLGVPQQPFTSRINQSNGQCESIRTIPSQSTIPSHSQSSMVQQHSQIVMPQPQYSQEKVHQHSQGVPSQHSHVTVTQHSQGNMAQNVGLSSSFVSESKSMPVQSRLWRPGVDVKSSVNITDVPSSKNDSSDFDSKTFSIPTVHKSNDINKVVNRIPNPGNSPKNIKPSIERKSEGTNMDSQSNLNVGHYDQKAPSKNGTVKEAQNMISSGILPQGTKPVPISHSASVLTNGNSEHSLDSPPGSPKEFLDLDQQASQAKVVPNSVPRATSSPKQFLDLDRQPNHQAAMQLSAMANRYPGGNILQPMPAMHNISGGHPPAHSTRPMGQSHPSLHSMGQSGMMSHHQLGGMPDAMGGRNLHPSMMHPGMHRDPAMLMTHMQAYPQAHMQQEEMIRRQMLSHHQGVPPSMHPSQPLQYPQGLGSAKSVVQPGISPSYPHHQMNGALNPVLHGVPGSHVLRRM